MTGGNAQLFRVTVGIENGPSWSVLVRAVDEASAMGAVGARGHRVIGVRPAEMPAKSEQSTPTPRAWCLNCGYSLARLPQGAAGETTCPECGVINTPILEDRLAKESVRLRRARRRKAWRMLVVIFLATLFVLVIRALA